MIWYDIYIYRVRQKNRGTFARCDIVLNHPIFVIYICPCSQESNLDHKRFPIQVGHWMHSYKKIFFVRYFMGVVQTVGIFCQVPSSFYVGKRCSNNVDLSEEDEIIRTWNILPWDISS